MAKKSFFEKLTGTSLSSGEEKEETTDDVNEEIIDDIDDEESTIEDVEIEEEEEITPTPEPAPEEPTPAHTPETQSIKTPLSSNHQTVTAPKIDAQNEITNESEGQLTIDVYQTPNDIIIKSTIAGVDPENIDINITNDMITIKGNRQRDDNVQENDYYYQECYWGSFSRSVILPVDVESDSANASMKNGILTVTLPKAEKVKVKKISISTE